MALYRTAAQEWSEKYNRLHAVPGKRGPVRLSRQGARILQMLAPYPWEPGNADIDIRGETLSWQPDMDSFVVGHAHDAAHTGFPRGDAARIMRAFEAAHGRSRVGARHVAKTELLYIVQGHYGYGYGWEDVSAETTHAEARARLREYRENERGGVPFRLIQRREPVPGRARKRRGKAAAPFYHSHPAHPYSHPITTRHRRKR
jgi:hypothetical protein